MAHMASRKSDERLLDWLTLSDKGTPVKKIAQFYGVSVRSVNQSLYRVRKDDRDAHAS